MFPPERIGSHPLSNVGLGQAPLPDQRQTHPQREKRGALPSFQCFYNANGTALKKKMNLNRKVLPPWVPIRVSGKPSKHCRRNTRCPPTGSGSGFRHRESTDRRPRFTGILHREIRSQSSFADRWLKKTASLVVWQVDYQAADCRPFSPDSSNSTA